MSKFREAVGIAIGEASMCWSEAPSGVFDSTRAAKLVDKIFDVFHLEAGMNVTRWVEVCAENKKLREENRELKSELESRSVSLEHTKQDWLEAYGQVQELKEKVASLEFQLDELPMATLKGLLSRIEKLRSALEEVKRISCERITCEMVEAKLEADDKSAGGEDE